MLGAYRHDAHKFTGEHHDTAPETVAGIIVNQPVPHGADGDAAALSCLPDYEQTVPTYAGRYRLSLITGEQVHHAGAFKGEGLSEELIELLGAGDAETAHLRWLRSDVAAVVNESVFHPYTSLKHHTLLVAALLDNYLAGQAFSDLSLVVDGPDAIVPFRTIFAGERFSLRIDVDPGGQPAAPLGDSPTRCWASTWNRLPAHPLDGGEAQYDRVLDANLRRIQSWSTALQYLEEFTALRPAQ